MKHLKKYLFNVILPFLFFELWYVAIAFIVIVWLETFIVNIALKQKFSKLFMILLKANFWTTIIGYFLQGLIRIIIGFITFILFKNSNENYLFEGIIGNVGLSKKITSETNNSIIITIITSSVIAFILSIVIERKIVLKKLDGVGRIKKITTAVIIANVISYTLLAGWIYFNYQRFANSN